MYFWKNDHTIEISGQTSEELTPRRGTKSNRLRFDPYCLKFNPLNNRIYTSGYRIRIRSYTRKQDCHGQLPAFLSKLAGDLFLFSYNAKPIIPLSLVNSCLLAFAFFESLSLPYETTKRRIGSLYYSRLGLFAIAGYGYFTLPCSLLSELTCYLLFGS